MDLNPMTIVGGGSDPAAPFVPSPTRHIDDLISKIRQRATQQVDLANQVAGDLADGAAHNLMPRSTDPPYLPLPPDPALIRGSNAELTPEIYRDAVIGAQLAQEFFNTPHPALGGKSPLEALRLVQE